MEPVGFAVGVVGLAGLFSVCLDAVERFDSWKKFDADLAFLGVRVEAERLRLDNWGQAVGISQKSSPSALASNGTKGSHHPELDDERTAATVKKHLTLLQAVCTGKDGVLLAEKMAEANPRSGQTAQNHFGISSGSKRARIKWALKDKAICMAQVEQLHILVQKLHDLVPLAGNGEGIHGAVMAQQTVDSVGNLFAERDDFRAMIFEMERSLNAETRKEVHSWLLGRHAPNEVFETALKARLDDTCQWIFDRQVFKDWASSNFPNRSAKYLWIHGPAAFGKTILSATLVQHMKSASTAPVAYYFFSSDLESRTDAFVAIRSWLVQLSSEEAVLDLLRAKWEQSETQMALPGEAVAAFKEVMAMLPECTLAIDGLDECTGDESRPTADYNTSLTAFLDTVDRVVSGTNTRILMTSRDDRAIRRGIMNCENSTAAEYKISQHDVRPDIDEYSRKVIFQKLPGKDESIRRDLGQRMAERCSGQFLWIKLQASALRSWKNKTQLEAAIEKTPLGLEDLYHRNWDKIMKLESGESQRACAMLKWIAFAIRPMTVAELTEALLVDLGCDYMPRDEMPDIIEDDYIDNEILRICASLLEIHESFSDEYYSSQTVHFTHFSAKQYVLFRLTEMRDTLMINERLRSSVEVACNTELAIRCLHYISIPDIWLQLDQDSHSVYRSFRNYAAGAWYQHAAISDHDEVVRRSNEFFTRSKKACKAWRDWFTMQEATENCPYELVDKQPLYYATLFNLIGTAKYLIQNGVCNVNDRVARSGNTILQVAIFHGHVEMVALLLRAGAEIATRGHTGLDALHVACFTGNTTLIRILLENGANVNSQDSKRLTPLHRATAAGHVDAVQMLLRWGADFSLQDERGITALHIGSVIGNYPIAKLLLDHRADLLLNDCKYDEFLQTVAGAGHLDVHEPALGTGLDTSAKQRRPTLHEACNDRNATTLGMLTPSVAEEIPIYEAFIPPSAALSDIRLSSPRALVDKEEDMSPNGLSPLNLATQKGNAEIVRLILDHVNKISAICTKDMSSPLRPRSECHQSAAARLLAQGHKDACGAKTVHFAASAGHTDIIQILFDYGASLSVVDDWGATPMQNAAAEGQSESVRLLIELGAYLLIPDNHGCFPIHVASRNGHLNVVKVLVESDSTGGASIDAQNSSGMTPINIASLEGHANIVRLLLRWKANFEQRNNEGWSPIMLASRCNHAEVIQLLLDAGANIADKTAGGLTLLHYASLRGFIDTVKLLLDKGADIAVIDNEGCSPIFLASTEGHTAVVRLLRDAGADLDFKYKYGLTLLHMAASQGHFEVAELLLESRPDVNAVDNNGDTPLHMAVVLGHVEIARLLIENGADVNMEDSNGQSALVQATASTQLVQMCVDAGAVIDALNVDGETALTCASARGHVDTAKLLLCLGASTEMRGRSGNTPLMAASATGDYAIASLLLAKGADLEAADVWNNTPLSFAAYNNQLKLTRLLLHNGANVATADVDARTPLALAAARDHASIVQLLLNTAGCTGNVDPEARDRHGQTPLSFAVRHRSEAIVRMLLSTGQVSVLSEDVMGRTPISWATQFGYANMDDFFSDSVLRAKRKKGSRWCDVCMLQITKSMDFHSCRRCAEDIDSFDICKGCYDLGTRCRNQAHQLEKNLREASL